MCTQNKIFIYKFSRFNSRATYNIMLRENSENSESASEMKINLLRAVSKIVTDLKQLYLRRSGLLLLPPCCCDDDRRGLLPNEIEKLNSSEFFQSCFWRGARSGVNARPLSSCSRRCFVVDPALPFRAEKKQQVICFSFHTTFLFSFSPAHRFVPLN